MKSALWALGFRPFFLFGCFSGVIALLMWLQVWLGWQSPAHVHILWHSHEMIHGFAVAIIIGFLYTASQNWTGMRGIHGNLLMLITACWAAGRLSFLIPGLPPFLVAIVDLSFLPIAGMALANYILRRNQRHNLVFLVLLGLLWVSNLVYHLEVLGWQSGIARDWLYFAVHIIVLMIIVVTSRIVPFFTEKAVPHYQRRKLLLVDISLIASTAIFSVSHVWFGPSQLTALFAASTAVLAFIRWLTWYDWGIWKIPILWILYIGYLWLIAGFVLSAFSSLGQVSPSTAVHAFTVGTISTMILGVISRVSLGHTGRPIKASTWTIASYVFIISGSIFRVIGPLLMPSYYHQLIIASGVLWALAFLSFIIIYSKILLVPRPDGRPG
ncbi:MAG: NnrS family protein [Oligoflexus sp.]